MKSLAKPLPYTQNKTAQAFRGMDIIDARNQSIDFHVSRNPGKAKLVLADEGDTHDGMPMRVFDKIAKTEGFEPLFVSELDICTSYGFGRRSDGVTVVFSAIDGAVRDAVGEFCYEGKHEAGFRPTQLLTVGARGGAVAATRFRFHPLNGFRLKLAGLGRGPGRCLPYWFSRVPFGDPVSTDGIFMTGLDDENRTPGGYFDSLPSGREMARVRIEESRRRFESLPPEWRHRLDIHRARTLEKAVLESATASGRHVRKS